MAVVYLNNSTPGGDAAATMHSVTPNSMNDFLVWAMPQLGWTLAHDDRANYRVAFTSADGITYAFYDQHDLPPLAGSAGGDAYDNTVGVRIFQGFTDFSSTGLAAPFDSSKACFFEKSFIRYSCSGTEFHVWGDNKSVVFAHGVSGVYLANPSPVTGSPRLSLHYFGRVEGLQPGQHNYVFLGSSYGGGTSTSASNVTMDVGGEFPALYDTNGNPMGDWLHLWNGVNRSIDNGYLSTQGDNILPDGNRYVSRVYLSPNSQSDEPAYYCRGMYCGVGNWREFIVSNHLSTLPALVLDTGSRSLTPVYTEYYQANIYTVFDVLFIFVDNQGPWA